MSEDDDDSGVPPPRSTSVLFGHAEAERTLLDSYRTGRIPHAWLIGGPRSTGKATLAFRMARFVLAHPDPAAREVQNATSLDVAAESPVARQVAGEAHPDLLVLKRTVNEKTGKLYQDIVADEVRRSVPFFGSTARAGGWRVAIVDAVDELNAAGENALLKVLEEPPQQSLLLLVSHAPGRVLPTIRSRCRTLLLRALSSQDVARAVGHGLGRSANEPEIAQAASAADGSVERALSLLDGPMLELRDKILAALGQLPHPDPQALHALGDALGGTDPAPLATFMDIVNGWLSAHLDVAGPVGQLARIAQAWDEINAAARDVEAYNLERKPFVFSVFAKLAEAMQLARRA